MRFLLDTNIISNVVKPRPSEALMGWLGDQNDQDLFIATLTVAELRRGILEKPAGKRRNALEAWFDGPEGHRSLFAGRILAFDERAALAWAEMMAKGIAKGRPRSALVTMIAAIAVTNDCIVVTDNEKDFGGIRIVNPLRCRVE